MAENRDLAARLEALEASLLVPEKRSVAQRGAAAAEARAKALGLPERSDVEMLSAQIAALSNRNDVVVEWRVRDVEGTAAAAAVACACCCCCCCYAVRVA